MVQVAMEVDGITHPQTVVPGLPEGAPEKPRFHYASLTEAGNAAEQLLAHIDHHPVVDEFTKGFIRSVQEIAHRGGSAGMERLEAGMERLFAALQKLATDNQKLLADNEKFHQRLSAIERSTKDIQTTTTTNQVTTSSDAADRWRSFRAGTWRQDLQYATAPQSQGSSGRTATPGIPIHELAADCEVVVKLPATGRERFAKTKPADLLRLVERARKAAAKKD